MSALLTEFDPTETAEDLFERARQTPLQKHYEDFYRLLAQLKEEFHSLGRFDDANAKLDEIAKLLAMKMLDARSPSSEQLLNLHRLSQHAKARYGSPRHVARALQDAFRCAASDRMFICRDGSSVFGDTPSLNIRATEDEFTERLVLLLAKLPMSLSQQSATDDDAGLKVDPLNEAFGHFLQRNFANRVEDAQYMTPPEVVDGMAKLALSDIAAENQFSRLRHNDSPFTLCDPTCGVGSLILGGIERLEFHAPTGTCRVVGQDKVDRMVRLAKLNLMLFGKSAEQIQHGNSILGLSWLDSFLGSVDLILTNPPFGAEMAVADVLQQDAARRFPITSALAEKGFCPRFLNSEFLMFDRCLGLLQDGGRMLIIVPDSVVSGSRFAADFREQALRFMQLKAVIDLPVETFAQAGTRTKTSIVYGVKRASQTEPRPLIFMAAARSLGFKVKERSGSTVKIAAGRNELEEICIRYARSQNGDGTAGEITPEDLINGKWTAAFYADRTVCGPSDASLAQCEYEMLPLQQVADLLSKQRRVSKPEPGTRCISVLHVNQAGIIDFAEVETYKSKFMGPKVCTGDVLLSKLNPQIPRVTFVPQAPWPLTCSTEFEILAPKDKAVSPLMLYLAVVHPITQEQIVRLSSGTSSSHRRIKHTELLKVKVPLPRKGTAAFRTMTRTAEDLKMALENIYHGLATLRSVRRDYGNGEITSPKELT
jgi:type I restriction-modification system DNA methylase subunit